MVYFCLMTEASQPVSSAESSVSLLPNETRRQRWIVAGAICAAILVALVAVASVLAMLSHPVQTETIRDIVIVFAAVEGLIIGIALIVLILQLARLTALIQNEVKPILDSTNETLSTFRGTTVFLSDNLARPVIRAAGAVSAIRRVFELLRFGP
jgi:hypothetical protein